VQILQLVQPNKVRTQDAADGHTVDYKLGSTTTTIGFASDGQTLPDSGPYTITVVSTTGFPTIGAVDINVNGVHNVVTYTGTTSTTFTGCHQGIPGTILHTGDVVTSDLVDVLPDRGCNQTRAVGYDHSDHVWGARFAREAIRRYANLPNSQNQPTYFTYKGYNLEWNEP
jgi:hypothetical protein